MEILTFDSPTAKHASNRGPAPQQNFLLTDLKTGKKFKMQKNFETSDTQFFLELFQY